MRPTASVLTASHSLHGHAHVCAQIIANDQGNRITPSYVAFTDSERLIGDAAKNQATVNPTRTIYDVKRLIGRSYGDKEVQRDKKLVSYNIVDKAGKPNVQVCASTECREVVLPFALGAVERCVQQVLLG